MTTAKAATPIGPADRVIDVLARDERLVEVFVHHASQFEKLRSPAVRRVMARLVTVEQAARMAGVTAETLVRDLNVALFGTEAAHAASAPPRRPRRPPCRGPRLVRRRCPSSSWTCATTCGSAASHSRESRPP